MKVVKYACQEGGLKTFIKPNYHNMEQYIKIHTMKTKYIIRGNYHE